MSGRGTEWPDEVIEHGPVTLRRFRADDLDALFGAVTESLDHLLAWMPWAAGYTRESAAEYLEKSIRSWADGTEYNYAIFTEGVLAGSIGLMTRSGPGSGKIPRKLGFTEIGHRALDHPAQAGNGTGIVWRLPRTQGPNEVT
jgi:GNAT acetyltransferase-like protein